MGTSQSQHETTSQSDQIRPSNSQSTQLEADVALINKNRIKKMIDQLDLDIKDASFILHEYSKEKESKTTLDILTNDFNMLKEKRNLLNNELTNIKIPQNISNTTTIEPKFVECFELKCPDNFTQNGTTCKCLYKSFQLKCPDKFIQQGTSCGYLVDALSKPNKYKNQNMGFQGVHFW